MGIAMAVESPAALARLQATSIDLWAQMQLAKGQWYRALTIEKNPTKAAQLKAEYARLVALFNQVEEDCKSGWQSLIGRSAPKTFKAWVKEFNLTAPNFHAPPMDPELSIEKLQAKKRGAMK